MDSIHKTNQKLLNYANKIAHALASMSLSPDDHKGCLLNKPSTYINFMNLIIHYLLPGKSDSYSDSKYNSSEYREGRITTPQGQCCRHVMHAIIFAINEIGDEMATKDDFRGQPGDHCYGLHLTAQLMLKLYYAGMITGDTLFVFTKDFAPQAIQILESEVMATPPNQKDKINKMTKELNEAKRWLDEAINTPVACDGTTEAHQFQKTERD